MRLRHDEFRSLFGSFNEPAEGFEERELPRRLRGMCMFVAVGGGGVVSSMIEG